jgi:hypothetical protein
VELHLQRSCTMPCRAQKSTMADKCTSLDRAREEIVIINLKTVPFLIINSGVLTRCSSVGIAPGTTGWTVRARIPVGAPPSLPCTGYRWFSGGKNGRCEKLSTYLQLEPRSKMSVAISMLLLYTLIALTGTTLPYILIISD